MDAFWIFVTYAFVLGTLATVALATARMFGGGHWHHH
jgi:hypothetical protein